MSSLKKCIFFSILSLLSLRLMAARVDTVMTYSAAMHKEIKACVIRPDSYVKSHKYPVLYFLHGYSGNSLAWASFKKPFFDAADRYKMLIVCVDGGFSSWYFDSPIDSTYRYETYVVRELIPWIDRKYSTVPSPKGRAVNGLSMGGHGAFYLSIRHQDVFGAVGSMSGGVDFRPFPNNWDIAKRLGTYAQYPKRWDDNTVTNMLDSIKSGRLKIVFDCGSSDFFYKVNEELHQKMIAKKIPHDYISRPGAHNAAYWENSLWYQLLFFDRYFHQ